LTTVGVLDDTGGLLSLSIQLGRPEQFCQLGKLFRVPIPETADGKVV
jgi:hypothetical protein